MRIVPKIAVELCSKEVGLKFGDDGLSLIGGVRVGELFVFGDEEVSVFGLEDGEDETEGDGVVDLIAGD